MDPAYWSTTTDKRIERQIVLNADKENNPSQFFLSGNLTTMSLAEPLGNCADGNAPSDKGGQDKMHKDSVAKNEGLKVKMTTRRPEIPSLFRVPTERNYFFAGFVQCCIVRDVQNSKSMPNQRFTFAFQMGHENIAMIAEKQLSGNRTSKYYFFDATRGGPVTKLNKKSGNYIGKLCCNKSEKGKYLLYNSREEKERVAEYVYQTPSILTRFNERHYPRRMRVVIPCDQRTNYISSSLSSRNEIVEYPCAATTGQSDLLVLNSKEPSQSDGLYRLNFGGRVSIPSVKNMQIEDDEGNIIAQFGRVGKHRFHLDYKAPMSAFLAFAMAVTQFDF